MVFRIQKISNYGTSTPAVARTVVQGCELLQSFPIKDEIEENVKNALFELKRHLLKCVHIRDNVEGEVLKGRKNIAENGLDFQSAGRAVTLPSVTELESQAESFLQAAKLAIQECAKVLGVFFDKSFDYRFHKIAKWFQKALGVDDLLTKCVISWEPWVKRIVDMRNAVDHPQDKPGGKLITYDFQLLRNDVDHDVCEPLWALSGESPRLILTDLDTIIEGIIRLSEDILTACLLKNRGRFPLYVYEIPENERDKSCPIRLRTGIHRPK